MAKYLLKQPDGKFAVFNAVVDTITIYDMSEAEALEFAAQEWGRPEAARQLQFALDDKPLENEAGLSDGLRRWRDCLTIIAMQHGIGGLRALLTEIGFRDAKIPQSAIDIADQIAEEAARGVAND